MKNVGGLLAGRVMRVEGCEVEMVDEVFLGANDGKKEVRIEEDVVKIEWGVRGRGEKGVFLCVFKSAIIITLGLHTPNE